MDVVVDTGRHPGAGDLREAGYELVCRLGEGGMGEVWAAARFGVEGAIKPCAIKLIRPGLADDERYRRMFVAEGRVAMMLGHANVVSVFDVGVVEGLLFMAMDWVDGVDLGVFRQQVQQSGGGRPLAVEDAAHVVGDLLDALGYAHGFSIAGREHGIVHRDVSPGNVMITSRGEVKLMDFGLAGLDRLDGLEPAAGPGAMAPLRGTLRYLSREQARGRPEPASDLFAVGAILHELLDGRRFRHWCATDEALVREIFDGGIPPLSRRVPGPIEVLRRGLLEPRVELRIKTARRALTTLAEWSGYRNRRFHLESLYRQVIGEPRSGLTQLLGLGVDTDRLEELRRRVEARRMAVPPVIGEAQPIPRDRPRTRESLRTVPYPTSAAGRRGVEAEASDAVVCARPPERASAHRVAQQQAAHGRVAASPRAAGEGSGDDEEPFERETTEPWPARRAIDGGAAGHDESATQWLTASSAAGEGAAAWVEGPGPREPPSPSTLAMRTWLAVLVGLAMLVGGVCSMMATVGVALGRPPATTGAWRPARAGGRARHGRARGRPHA